MEDSFHAVEGAGVEDAAQPADDAQQDIVDQRNGKFERELRLRAEDGLEFLDRAEDAVADDRGDHSVIECLPVSDSGPTGAPAIHRIWPVSTEGAPDCRWVVPRPDTSQRFSQAERYQRVNGVAVRPCTMMEPLMTRFAAVLSRLFLDGRSIALASNAAKTFDIFIVSIPYGPHRPRTLRGFWIF